MTACLNSKENILAFVIKCSVRTPYSVTITIHSNLMSKSDLKSYPMNVKDNLSLRLGKLCLTKKTANPCKKLLHYKEDIKLQRHLSRLQKCNNFAWFDVKHYLENNPIFKKSKQKIRDY